MQSVWKTDGDATEILEGTEYALGWDSRLSEAGYTLDYDGVPAKYSDMLRDRVDLSSFTELHFPKGS